MQNATSLEAVLKRDRTVVVTGLVGISVLAWAYIIYLAWNMEHMDMEVAMPQMQAWGVLDLVLLFAMWAVMMVAMMVPSAAPLILIFAAANRKRKERKDPFVHTAVFLTGYLLVWTGFSALATLAQWGLHNAALLSPMMKSTSSILGGILLLAAGIFQWTPFKHACLTHCRSPLGFLMAHWREGTKGSWGDEPALGGDYRCLRSSRKGAPSWRSCGTCGGRHARAGWDRSPRPGLITIRK
jgi:predicted metal-binding membrane protein